MVLCPKCGAAELLKDDEGCKVHLLCKECGWIYRETQLQPWEEAIGIFEDVKITKEKAIVTIATHENITFAKEHAQKIIQALQKTPKGTKIALLRTDDPEKPVVLRTFNPTTSANTHGSA